MAMTDRGFSLYKALIFLVMLIFTVLAVYPILWLIVQSFKTTQEYLSSSKLALPKLWFTGNYPYTWRMGKFGTLMANSVFYTAITVIAVVTLGFMAGFAFAKIKNRATPLVHGIFIIGILLTLQSIMVPLFLMVNAVGFYNTRLGVLIPALVIGMIPMMAFYLIFRKQITKGVAAGAVKG
jgi:raffinose/stachyose/melibiose transport system permease protein